MQRLEEFGAANLAEGTGRTNNEINARAISRGTTTQNRAKLVFLGTALSVVLSACSLSGTQGIGFQEQIEVGEQLLEVGEHRRAYAILEGISENQKGQPKAQIAIGDSYLRSNALLRAEGAYTRAAELGDKRQAEIGLGKVALKRNNAEAALFHFQNVLAKDDDNLDALNGMGIAYDLSGQHKLAQDSYRRVIAVQPDHTRALNNLGLSLVLGGNANAGAETLSLLSQSNLDDRTTRMNLAIALNVAGYKDQAALLLSEGTSKREANQIFSAVRAYVGSKT